MKKNQHIALAMASTTVHLDGAARWRRDNASSRVGSPCGRLIGALPIDNPHFVGPRPPTACNRPSDQRLFIARRNNHPNGSIHLMAIQAMPHDVQRLTAVTPSSDASLAAARVHRSRTIAPPPTSPSPKTRDSLRRAHRAATETADTPMSFPSKTFNSAHSYPMSILPSKATAGQSEGGKGDGATPVRLDSALLTTNLARAACSFPQMRRLFLTFRCNRAGAPSRQPETMPRRPCGGARSVPCCDDCLAYRRRAGAWRNGRKGVWVEVLQSDYY